MSVPQTLHSPSKAGSFFMRVNLPRFTLSRMRRLILLLIAATPCAAEDMATGFVYLRDVDPTILQDMRYAGPGNFTGHAVPGYDAPECVLVRKGRGGSE